MTPEEQKALEAQAAAKKTADDAAAATAEEERKNREQAVPYNRFKEVIDQKNTLETRLAEIERKQKEQTDAKMLEDGKAKELAQQRLDEIEKIKKQLEEVNSRATAYEKSIKDLVESEKSTLPEEWKEMIPDGTPNSQLDYIRRLKEKLAGQSATGPDGKPVKKAPVAPRPAGGGKVPEPEVDKVRSQIKELEGKTDPASKLAKFRLTNYLYHLTGGIVGTEDKTT